MPVTSTAPWASFGRRAVPISGEVTDPPEVGRFDEAAALTGGAAGPGRLARGARAATRLGSRSSPTSAQFARTGSASSATTASKISPPAMVNVLRPGSGSARRGSMYSQRMTS